MEPVPDPHRRRLLAVTAALVAAGIGGATLRWLLDGSPESVVETADGARQDAVATTHASHSTTSTTTVAEPVETTTTDRPPDTSSTSTTTRPTTSLPTLMVPVICREAWGAQPVNGDMEEHRIDRLTVHHTAVPIASAADGPAQLRSHQRFHQDTRGWPDLAYHYMIDPGGNVYQGRDVSYRGDTATEYDPSGHFLVCVDGEFDSATPNQAQLDALIAMLAYGAHTYGINATDMAGHRDYASTSCPGDNLYSLIEDGWLAQQVLETLGSGIPTLSLVCGDEGTDLVNRIEEGEGG